jgi:hypothetical protein
MVSLTEIDFPRLMLDFLYPPIKMVITDETARKKVLNSVVAFSQLVPFAGPYHMVYDSDFLVFQKHRRFHVALPFLLRTLIDNSSARHVTNRTTPWISFNLFLTSPISDPRRRVKPAEAGPLHGLDTH